MMNLIPKTNFDFLKNRRKIFLITILIMAACIVGVVIKGLNFGIDFKGGTMVQVKFEQPTTIAQVRTALTDTAPDAEIQSFTDRNAFAIKIKGKQEEVNAVQTSVEKAFHEAKLDYVIEQTDFVGPAVGRELSLNAFKALAFSLVFMVIYIAFRFSNITWGASAVLALIHDVIIMVGLFAFTQGEVDLVIIAALLTAVGYSINDNIVVFDRMRENLQLHPKMGFYELVNLSLNETLSRTIITGGSVIIALIVLYFCGGAVLQNFALIMLVGTVAGTYSTLFVATPLVYEWAKDSDDIAKLRHEAKVAAKAEVKAAKKEVKKEKKKYRNN
ncbi:preprotein translocase subunit SecF [Elusimicrobium posterum]|uniref:protein translocase subunit SecF n=1 Tax=Elusimicrobium posterum TaxID=3116653 RepID=UPI003C750EC7